MADLVSLVDAAALVASGQPMLVAGDATQLEQLPKGRWIGGTTPYFMSAQGGVVDRERVCVTRLPEEVCATSIRIYEADQLEQIPENYPSNGCSFIILPTGSSAHLRFARECVTWLGLFNSPLVGWNAGVHLGELDLAKPRVFDGTTLQSYDNAVAVLHASLDPGHLARVEIVNAFSQGDGDRIGFLESGFKVKECLVNGELRNFAEYIQQKGIDTRWPLVADYAGASINVSFQSVDESTGQVRLYAPVFAGMEYRIAAPVNDLAGFFGREFDARKAKPAFCCNCILNFLYAELEGRMTGTAMGPITFGEVAYIQMNQTLVYVTFEPEG